MVPPQRRRRREGGELAERREADEREDERAHGYAVRLRARVWRLAGGPKGCDALFGSRVNAVVVCAAAGVAKGGVVVHAEGCVGARTGRRATQSYFLRPKREQEA